MIPEGIYTATASGSQILESGTGSPYVAVAFTIPMGDAEASGTAKIWLTPKNREKARRELLKLGVSGRKVSTLDPSSPAYESLCGIEFPVRVKHTTWNDKPRAEFEIVTGDAPKNASPDRLAQIDDLFADTPEDKQPSAETPEGYQAVDSDLPF